MADAGPLIALARLEQLALPAKLFRVMVTSTVLAECEVKPDCDEGLAIRNAVDRRLFRLIDAPDIDCAWGIDAGEASAIAVYAFSFQLINLKLCELETSSHLRLA